MSEPVKFSNLSESQRHALSDIFRQIEKFREFESKCNFQLFKFLFGKQADHLFVENFVRKSNRCIFAFLRISDQTVKETLYANIFYNPTLYAHCR